MLVNNNQLIGSNKESYFMVVMDASLDVFLPALLFTLLAIIVVAVITGKNKCRAPSECTQQTTAAIVNDTEEESSHNNDTNCNATHHPETNANKPKDETIQSDSSPDHEEEICSSRWEEDSSEYGIRNALKDYTDAEEKPLRYMAGMLRATQLEKMMTKEELEEEQRVQRDQLAAIFQLLRDKQETFGDVTESDLEEQLKLYSI